MAIAAAFNYQEMVGLWQPLLALVTFYEGNLVEARRLLDECLRLCLELKDKHFLARIYAYQAEFALSEGKINEAAPALAQSLACEPEVRRITIYEMERLWLAARLAATQQQYQRATVLFGLADQVHRQMHYAIAGPMRAVADEALATVQTALAPAVFAEAFATGQQMALTEAFTTILTPEQWISAV